MKLLSIHFSLIFCAASVSQSAAQQVYQSQHYGGPGTQQLYSRHLVGFTNDDIISHGADATWDISALTASDLILSEIVTRDEAIDAFTFTALCSFGGINVFTCLNIWSNTQQAWLIQDTQSLVQFAITDLQRFQRKTPTLLLETFLGFTVDLGGSPTPVAIVYQAADTTLTFPMTYEDSLSSRIAWGLDLSATGQNIQYLSHQFRTSKVDGWGTLITPYDTLHDVLRVRAVISRNDTLTTDTLVLPVTLSQVEYTWYDTSYGIPVMIAAGFVTDSAEIINTVTYLVAAECPAPTWFASTQANEYYIDDTGAVLAGFSIAMSNAGVYSWDFDDGTIESSTDDISHIYTTPGIYNVVVTGCMTNCLPLNSCTEQTLTIEVIDSTSAVQLLNPKDYGIRIYPNPAHSDITLDIPLSFGELDFQLLDIHGKVILTGPANTGVNRIDITPMTSGLYLMRILDRTTGMLYKAERISVLK